MRTLKPIYGIAIGILIVALFAAAIQATNYFFSHALYTRDAREAAVRLTEELGHLGRVLQDEQTGAPRPLSENGLRQTLDASALAAQSHKPLFTQGMSNSDLAGFMRHMEMHKTVRTLAVIWFGEGPTDAALASNTTIPAEPQAMVTIPADRLASLLRKVQTSGEPQVSISAALFTDQAEPTLLALPLPGENGPAGAMLLSYNQATTGEFLGDVVKSGIIIVLAMCFVAMLLAGLFVWIRFRDRLEASQTIQFLAHHDALTGLPNRTVFSTKLNEALRISQSKASDVAVMLVDVDKFKEVNDTHGHAVGDLFLQVIADRLTATFDNHLVARLSGDEFAVLLANGASREDVTRYAAAMIAATRTPTQIDGRELPISLSIGVAQAKDAAWRASRLLHCADLALYRAKHSGRGTFIWYTADMDADAKRRKALEMDLRKALKQDQFRLLYQPQFSLRDRSLTGYETLLRWEHPEKGTISPTVFIPIAEDAGLIEEIGSWVLLRACQEAAAWHEDHLTISVNVSPAQFRPGKTEQRVSEALEASGLPPQRLEIEITESLLISDTDAVVSTLGTIREMGVSVAMDDFGTGYSSLSYLSRFPFDTIKIDRSFVATLGKNPTTDAIVASIVGLGRSLDVTITAEGVENEDQVALLRAAGCDKVQGFLFGRPMTLPADGSPAFADPAPSRQTGQTGQS